MWRHISLRPAARAKGNFLLGFLVAVSSCFVLDGQATTGDLTVNVRDQNGAAVPNAKLELENSQAGISLSAESNSVGTHIFSQLRPGSYSLNVTVPGFQAQHVTDSTLQLAQRANVNITLSVGQLSQTVDVSAAETLLNTESSAADQVLQEHAIQNLPLNSRNFIQPNSISPTLAISAPYRRRSVPTRKTSVRR